MFQDANKCHIKHILTINKGLLCFIPGFIRSKGESEYQSLPRTNLQRCLCIGTPEIAGSLKSRRNPL